MEAFKADLQFPAGGIQRRFGFQDQPPYTTPDAVNVRTDTVGSSTLGGRSRGGSRPGLGKASSQQLGSGSPIRAQATLTYISGSSLLHRLMAISSGKLYRATTDVAPWTVGLAGTTGGTFNSAKLIQMHERGQVLYIADHSDDTTESSTTYQPKKYTPATDTIANWTASDGTIPYGSTCFTVWRDRAVLAGGTTNPYGVFASRQGDFEDFDYGEDDEGSAWNLALAEAGQMGDTVTCLAPHHDNCCLVGCKSSLWLLRGDPTMGGQTDNLSQVIGVVDKNAWCFTPDGLFVFLSRDGLYAVPAGCGEARFPQSISREKLPIEMLAIDPAVTTVSMAYDVQDRGIHVFLTPITAGDESATHWWLDWEAKSFWKVEFPDTDFEPFTAAERRHYTGDGYSHTILGCRDGYLRRFQDNLAEDDGLAFDSYVLLGPIGDPELLNESILTQLCASIATQGGNVAWEILRGNSPEEAFDSEPVRSGVFGVAGRNRMAYPRVRGQALYVKLKQGEDSQSWGLENGYAILVKAGRVRV